MTFEPPAGRTDSDPPLSQHTLARRRGTLALLIAALAGGAVLYEAYLTVSFALTWNEPLAPAVFRFLRFFTIETNSFIAITMALTAGRVLKDRTPPPGRLFDAALVYALVTCAAFEVLLRPPFHGVTPRFIAGVTLHDVVPALTALFWWHAAPKEARGRGDVVQILVFPIAYFALVLTAGAFGQGYPYNFLDVDRLGLIRVCLIGLGFLGVFALLAAAARELSARRLTR